MVIDLRPTAFACIAAGVSIVPIDHGTKRPLSRLLPRDDDGKPHWKPYQHELPTHCDIGHWCDGGAQAIAVVAGKVSGGLLILDFDVPRFYTAWCEKAGDLAEGLPVQQTGGGGYQVFLRCPDPGGNEKLAWAPHSDESTGRTIAIETRGEGGYAVVAPSLHPSGNTYRMVSGDLASIPAVSQAVADALKDAARQLDEMPFTRQELDRRESTARADHRKRGAARNGQASVIDAFNEAHPIEAVLEQHGYTRGSSGRYIRPGGSGESVSIKDGRSCHWSTNDPLNDDQSGKGFGCHDAFDIYAHFNHGCDISKAVKAASEELGLKHNESTGHGDRRAKRRPRPTIPFRAFPLEALPPVVATYVRTVSSAIGCDPCFVALALLVALASAIGNSRRIQLKRGWTEPSILWGSIIGESGCAKSPALELALKGVRSRQAEAMRAYREAMPGYEAAQATHERALAQWKRSTSTGQAPIAPTPPSCDRYWTDDATIEAVAKLLEENARGMLVIRDELSGWLHFDRYSGGGKGGEVAKWLEMHGGRPLIVDRRTSGTIYVPHAAVSIIGGIQPGILARYVGQEHRDNGLLARLLLVMPPRLAKCWTDADIDPDVEADIARIFSALYALNPTCNEAGEPRPAILSMTTDALQAWIRFYNDHNEEQATLSGDLAAAWSKLEGYAARFALINHLVQQASADCPGRSADAIGVESIEAGATLSRWFAYEARRVYAVLGEDEYRRQHRQLVELIERHGGKVSVRDWHRIRSLSKSEDAEAELADLVEAGFGRWLPPKTHATGGRPSKGFVLNEHVAMDVDDPDTEDEPEPSGHSAASDVEPTDD